MTRVQHIQSKLGANFSSRYLLKVDEDSTTEKKKQKCSSSIACTSICAREIRH